MTITEYQNKANETAVYNQTVAGEELSEKITSYLNLTYAALGLAGEAGEISNKIKKVLRDSDFYVTDDTRANVKKELGDVLWYCAAVAKEMGFSLEDVAKDNIVKLSKRKLEGVLQGSGDDR